MLEILLQKNLEKSAQRPRNWRMRVLLGMLGSSGVLGFSFAPRVEAQATPKPPAGTFLTPQIQETPPPLPRQLRQAYQRERFDNPPTPSPRWPEISATPAPTEPPLNLESSDETQVRLNDIVVYINNEGLPTAYLDPIQQVRIELNDRQREQVRQDQARAISRGLPSLSILIHQRPQPLDLARYELPADVVDANTLAEDYGITVFNSPRVDFNFRQSTFAEGGLLEFQQTYYETTGVELWIVLIDDFVVRGNNLGAEVPDDIRQLLPTEEYDVQSYRERYITAYQNFLAQAEASFEGRETEMMDMMSLARVLEYFQTASDDAILAEMQNTTTNRHVGLHGRPRTFYRETGAVTAAIIFLAVGDRADASHGLTNYRFFFTPTGELRIAGPRQTPDPGPGFAPNPDLSYPQLDDLQMRGENDPNGYLIGAQANQAGISAAHELEHHVHMTIIPRLFGTAPDSSEHIADQETLEYLAQAGFTLENGSDHKYHFAIRGLQGTQISKASAN